MKILEYYYEESAPSEKKIEVHLIATMNQEGIDVGYKIRVMAFNGRKQKILAQPIIKPVPGQTFGETIMKHTAHYTKIYSYMAEESLTIPEEIEAGAIKTKVSTEPEITPIEKAIEESTQNLKEPEQTLKTKDNGQRPKTQEKKKASKKA